MAVGTFVLTPCAIMRSVNLTTGLLLFPKSHWSSIEKQDDKIKTVDQMQQMLLTKLSCGSMVDRSRDTFHINIFAFSNGGQFAKNQSLLVTNANMVVHSVPTNL